MQNLSFSSFYSECLIAGYPEEVSSAMRAATRYWGSTTQVGRSDEGVVVEVTRAEDLLGTENFVGTKKSINPQVEKRLCGSIRKSVLQTTSVSGQNGERRYRN